MFHGQAGFGYRVFRRDFFAFDKADHGRQAHPISSPLTQPIMAASRRVRFGRPPPSTAISISPMSNRPTPSNVTPSTKKPANPHTTSLTALPAGHPMRPTRNSCSTSIAGTGVSRIAATTSSIGITTKTAAVSAPATAQKTSPGYAALPSHSSNPKRLATSLRKCVNSTVTCAWSSITCA